MNCEPPANGSVEFIEEAHNAPVYTAELVLQELFIPFVGWPSRTFDGRHLEEAQDVNTRT